jgi:hypothetical protein
MNEVVRSNRVNDFTHERTVQSFEQLVPFLLVHFLWMNDWLSSDTKSLDKERTDFPKSASKKMNVWGI